MENETEPLLIEPKAILAEDKEVHRRRDSRGRDSRGRNKESYKRFDEEKNLDGWIPKTELGKDVKAGKIKSVDEIFESGRKILEAEIVDSLLDLKSDLLNVGQSKGKFGGGKRRAFKQTQKKTKEGNVPTFSVLAVVGNEQGYIGMAYGRAKETLPAREKAIRKAKLNIQKIQRGCGSYDCSCKEPHSIPMRVQGKCSSVTVKLMPAPQGTGLVAGDQLKKILKLVGIKDIYTKTSGTVRTTLNTAKACVDALEKLNDVQFKK
ncbi:MAG: 30S ribosomal protein S5 [Nanoarchaeota archaeon]|nr:30S ribosomal protein S5 [Nanoarchaeota archaeon]